MFVENWLLLTTHFFPMFPFYTSWKDQKSRIFSDLFKGYKIGILGRNGLIRLGISFSSVIFIHLKNVNIWISFLSHKLLSLTYSSKIYDAPRICQTVSRDITLLVLLMAQKVFKKNQALRKIIYKLTQHKNQEVHGKIVINKTCW